MDIRYRVADFSVAASPFAVGRASTNVCQDPRRTLCTAAAWGDCEARSSCAMWSEANRGIGQRSTSEALSVIKHESTSVGCAAGDQRSKNGRLFDPAVHRLVTYEHLTQLIGDRIDFSVRRHKHGEDITHETMSIAMASAYRHGANTRC